MLIESPQFTGGSRAPAARQLYVGGCVQLEKLGFERCRVTCAQHVRSLVFLGASENLLRLP